jgi:diguanylate cyclase (GGDEF)-like protein
MPWAERETLPLKWWTRISLRAATGLGAAAVLTGLAALVYWRFAAECSAFFAGAGGLLIATGLVAAGLALVFGPTREELLQLRREADVLRAERTAQLAKLVHLERRNERLALVREIHQSTNIVTRAERLRQILSLIGQIGERVEVALFAANAHSPTSDDERTLRPAAYLRSFEEGEVFLRIDRAPAPEAGLAVADAAIATNGLGQEIAGDLTCEGETIGRIEASISPEGASDDPGVALGRFLAEADLDCGPAVAALEQGHVLRSHDATTGEAEFLYPLTAEGGAVGALRVRLPADGPAYGPPNGQLKEIEEALTECTRHVALALKKETDADRAITDGLTGLLIRREFEPSLERALVVAAEEKSPLALLMIDIDHFKSVNDTNGHRSGDCVLRGVAAVIRRQIRACDSAYRYGGEEMCVVLPGSGTREAKKTAERLRAAVEETSFGGDTGQPIDVTISIGLAGVDPRRSRARSTGAKTSRGKAIDLGKLVSRADAAVYYSKETGRNRVSAWNRKIKPKASAAKRSKTTKKKAKTSRESRKPTTRAPAGAAEERKAA